MSVQIQQRGASAATQNARTLAAREIDIDTTNKRVAVHDGSRTGGYHMANYFDIQNQSFSYIGASGTNAITATYAPVPSAYTAGQSFKFKAANTNTGAVTLNVNSLGAKNVYKRDKASGTLVALVAGDIIQNGIYTVDYDGTQFQLISDPASVSGGVAFKAYLGVTGTSYSTAKLQLDTEYFDTGTYFDSTTNYRFTPLVSGYYAFNGSIYSSKSDTAARGVSIYFNGTEHVGSYTSGASSGYEWRTVSTVLYMNGSTDYVELYSKVASGSQTVDAAHLSGFKILGL